MSAATARAPIAGFTSDSTLVDGVRLHHWTGGDPQGPPVLLWHGFLGTAYVWRKVAPVLAAAGLSVLIPDMRGYGDSDKPEGTTGYDARALAGEFRALVAQLGFGGGRPLTLVAHDMGAPPALLWAADHPDEVAGLVYLEEPVLLQEVLSKIISFTPQAMERGSLWWWILPRAPGAPEALIVGNERRFLRWFYDRDPSTQRGIEPAAVDEYLRSFSGREGVLGALGVYRAAFTTMEQTAPLTRDKVQTPVVALGGERALGDRVRQQVELVAADVRGATLPDCGHFIAEERPDEVAAAVIRLIEDTSNHSREGRAT